jgi:hypothetical protein
MVSMLHDVTAAAAGEGSLPSVTLPGLNSSQQQRADDEQHHRCQDQVYTGQPERDKRVLYTDSVGSDVLANMPKGVSAAN